MKKYDYTKEGYSKAKDFLLKSGYMEDYLVRLDSHFLIHMANKESEKFKNDASPHPHPM